MIGIYKIYNNLDNKVYIGQTKNLEKRFSQHIDHLRRNKHFNNHLQNAYNKYGEDVFQYSILEVCSESDLTLRENYWINYYGGLKSDNLYNLKGGEDVYYFSKEIRLKISKNNKGKHFKYNNGMYQKHHSIESKKKISNHINNKGKNNPMYGKHHSVSTRQKISKCLKGRVMTDETKLKMSISAKIRAQDPKNYKILCNNMNKRKVKYDKEIVVELQEKHKEGNSIRSLSKIYDLPYETTRQLINRNIEQYYLKYETV